MSHFAETDEEEGTIVKIGFFFFPWCVKFDVTNAPGTTGKSRKQYGGQLNHYSVTFSYVLLQYLKIGDD